MTDGSSMSQIGRVELLLTNMLAADAENIQRDTLDGLVTAVRPDVGLFFGWLRPLFLFGCLYFPNRKMFSVTLEYYCLLGIY